MAAKRQVMTISVPFDDETTEDPAEWDWSGAHPMGGRILILANGPVLDDHLE